MKRSPKPFTVEIKKSRSLGQLSHLPPKPLFEMVPAEAPRIFRTEEPQAAVEALATPRILPSIVDPMWSNPEAAEPVQRQRSSRAKVQSEQTELDLTGRMSEAVRDVPTKAAAFAEGLVQTGTALTVEENASPAPEAQPTSATTKAKSRRSKTKPPAGLEESASSPLTPDVEQTFVAEERDLPLGPPRKAGQHRVTKRQAAVDRLPRSERWKRRLPSVAW